MAIANKLEITLSFKPLMDGLNRFTAGLNQRLKQVQDFNAKIRNGDAALQSALGQVGAVLGAAALTRFAREAREADKVQAQLISTLARTKQSGAIDALNAQAAALQKLTLFGDESINTVQRLLITYGLTAEQTMGMTEAVLDFAQANNISAESAAQFIGKALKGDSAELGRYNIVLDRTKDRVTAVTAALREFANGQSRAAVPDAATRDVEARFADATENLGRATNQVAVPFLQALIPLLERVAQLAQGFSDALKPIAPILGNLASLVLAAVVPLGLLKGAMTAVKMATNLLSSGFAALAGKSFLQLNTQLALMTQRFGKVDGLLRTFTGSWANLGRAVAVATMALSAFFLGFEAGKMVIAAIESAAMRRLEAEDAVGARIAEQNKALNQQISSIGSLTDARKAQAAIEERVSKDRARIAELEKKEADGAKKRERELANSEGRRAVGVNVGALDPVEASELRKLRANVALMEAQRRTVNDPAFIERLIQQNVNASASASLQMSDEERETAERLRHTRALFELETQIREAAFDGNTTLEDRLIAERDLLINLDELGRDQYELAVNRINIEADERERKRKEEADKKAKDEAELAAAKTRQEQEQQYSREIAALEFDLQLIEQDRFLLQEEKDRLRIAKLDEINAKIAARIALLEREQELQPDPERQGQIDGLRGQQRDNQAQGDSLKPLSILGGLEAAAVAMQSRIGTIAQQISGAFTSVGDSIRTSLGGALADMVLRATSFKDAVIGFSSAVATAFVNAGAQMVADWIMSHLIMENVRRIFGLKRVAEEATTQAALTGIEATGATARTGIAAGAAATNTAIATTEAGAIATAAGIAGVFRSIMELGPIAGPLVFGTAIAGMVALVASLAKGFATGGIVEGPGSGTSDSILARLSNGEGVIRARSVGLFGRDFIEGINAGILDLDALPSHIAAGLTLPDYALPGGGRMPLQGRSGGSGEAAASPTFVFVDSPASAARAQRKYTDARFVQLSRKHQGRRIR